MRAGPRLRVALGAALALGCQAPPGHVEASAEREPVPIEVEAVPEPAAEPESAGPPEEDPLLADARRSIVGGRLSPEARRALAGSDAPHHRRATRLLQALAEEEPSPIVEPEPAPVPEPEPVVEREPVVEPEPEPVPEPVFEPEPSDTTLDDLDPRRFPADSAVGSWFVGAIWAEPPAVPVHDPFAGLFVRDDPRVLLPLDRPGVLPKVILTRLDLVAAPGVVRLEIVGSGSLDLRVQALDAYHLRVRIEQAGAVPGFLAARPSQPELAVIDVRRGRGCVEVDLELAFGWALLLGRSLGNGSELEFAAVVSADAEG